MATIEELRQEPHWSYSALNTYLNICQAQFMYRYVDQAEVERTSVCFPFGKAFHAALTAQAWECMMGNSLRQEWRKQPIIGEHPYVFVDGVYLKRSWGGEVQNVSVLVAVGVNDEGYRELPGVAEGRREDKESWSNFLRYLKERGLKRVRLIVSDKCLGLYEIIGDFFPEAKWQCCIFRMNTGADCGQIMVSNAS